MNECDVPEPIDLAGMLAAGRPVVPACRPAKGAVWIRRVDASTVSFTCEEHNTASVFQVSLDDGSCERIHTFERPPRTANVWKNCEALVRDGQVYTLVRYAPDRYVVTDVARCRSISLPIRPDARDAIGTVCHFHADDDRVVYLCCTEGTGAAELIVACDWTGAVEWTLGLEDAFPELNMYLWETNLCPNEDGSFLVFVNGENYPDGRDTELVVGLLWVAPNGEIREAFWLPWWPALMPEDEVVHVDDGGGFLLADRPVLVAHLGATVALRERTGHRVVLEAQEAGPNDVRYYGTVLVDGRLVIGHGERGLMVHELRGRTGIEPVVASPIEGRTGLEPSL